MQGMLWLLRRPTVFSADRVIGEPALGHRRHVSRAVGAIQAALGNMAVKIRRILPPGKNAGLRQCKDTF